MLSLQNRSWLVGVLVVIWTVFFVMVVLNAEIIYFLAVASAAGFGGLLWRLVVLLIPLVVGMMLWIGVSLFFDNKFHGKSLQACLGRLCFGSVMYHLWKHRNDIQHGNILSSEEAILIQIF
jgi:hypothetical protein